MIVLGVDPGVSTALIVRHGDRLLDALVLDLDFDRLEWSIDVATLKATDLCVRHGVELVAVEGAVAPTAYNGGKIRIIDPAPIIGTAHLVGALVGCLAATIVPPGGHGLKIPAGTPPKAARRMLEALYPAELIGPRETTGRSKTPNQHLRAAWDIAGATHRASHPPTQEPRT